MCFLPLCLSYSLQTFSKMTRSKSCPFKEDCCVMRASFHYASFIPFSQMTISKPCPFKEHYCVMCDSFYYASFLHNVTIQVIRCGVITRPQHLTSSEIQAAAAIVSLWWLHCLPVYLNICLIISLDSSMSRTVHPLEPLKVDVKHSHKFTQPLYQL